MTDLEKELTASLEETLRVAEKWYFATYPTVETTAHPDSVFGRARRLVGRDPVTGEKLETDLHI